MHDFAPCIANTSEPPMYGPDPNRPARIRDLEDRITELTAHMDAATWRWLQLVREFDACNGWVGTGLRSCAHWLNWKCGLELGTARERVRVAHALPELPCISNALRDGRISYSKVRAMTRVATRGNEQALLDIALCGTATHLERLVRHYRKVERSEALKQDIRRYDLRELTWYTDDDGSFILRGRFTPEQGALIRQALEAALEEQFAEQEDVPAETSDADNAYPPKPPPVASRRADALARIAEGWMAGSKLASGGGDRFLVHVHTDIETLKSDGCGSEAEIEDVGNVPAETSRRLACDAAVVQWLEGADGEPLSVGRKTRVIPPAIRRALQRRDGGCCFPGCTATRFVDAHHIHHWADGGATHLDNLTLLCHHHHRLVHEGGYGLRRTLAGTLEFTTPDGKPIPAAATKRFRGNVLSLMDANARTGIRITPKTPVPHWYGESLDFEIAMNALRRRE